MSVVELEISKNWYLNTTVQESNWDRLRTPLLAFGDNTNRNLEQITKDAFGTTYSIDNDGVANLSTDLQTQINNIVSGTTALEGTVDGDFFVQVNNLQTNSAGSTNETSGFRFGFGTDALVGRMFFGKEQDYTVDANSDSFFAVQTDLNGTLNERMRVSSAGVLTVATIAAGTAGAIPPVGTIIAHYDFNGALTIDTTYWRYCDGTAGVTIGGIGAQTLPDLSNRYLVGFGTETGGDIDTAAWATAAVGNANHTSTHTHTGAAHTHSTPSHAHSLSAHTHTGPSHTHDTGTLKFQTTQWQVGATDIVYFFDSDGSTSGYTLRGSGTVDGSSGSGLCQVIDGGAADAYGYTGTGSGSTGASGTGATGGPSVDATNTSGSGTSGSTASGAGSGPSSTDFQPRSIRVRFIMRVA